MPGYVQSPLRGLGQDCNFRLRESQQRAKDGGRSKQRPYGKRRGRIGFWRNSV